VLAAFVVAKDTITLTHAVVANVAAAATVTILAYGPLLTVLGGRLRTVAMHLDRRTVGEFARFNVTTFFSSALKAGSRNVDTLVLGYVTTPAVVGLYSLFRQFLAPLPFASAPIATLTYPKFVQAVIERRHADARQAIAAVNRKLSLVYATLLLLVGPALLGYLYWMHIGVGTPELLALAMMALTAYLSGRLWWARPYANAVDPVISLRANLYATLAILVLLYPLTSALGMAGTALCMLSQAVLLVIYFRKLLSHAPPARREHGT
jgi:O-antigen/teichoic acid export membrane protein